MWGDPKAAVSLEASDPLASVLFQVTGPAHIPLADPRWQELLHGYNVWVHVEEAVPQVHRQQHQSPRQQRNLTGTSTTRTSGGRIVQQACTSLIAHAPRSSNLAALALHVTRLLNELVDGSSDNSSRNSVNEFSSRIARVGKARAAAGTLHLFRILTHAVVIHASSLSSPSNEAEDAYPSSYSSASDAYLLECFTYRSRDHHLANNLPSSHGGEVDASSGLVRAILAFLSSNPLATPTNPSSPSMNASNSATTATATTNRASILPEIYDTTLLALQLLMVLLSSQLYQPMISSFQRLPAQRGSYYPGQSGATSSISLFWGHLMTKDLAADNLTARLDNSTANAAYTPRALLRTMLQWIADRPSAPDKSLAKHHNWLVQSIVHARGVDHSSAVPLGPDGMYESSHAVVNACAPLATANSAVMSTSGAASSSLALTNRSHSKLLLDATKGVISLSSSIIFLPFRLLSLAIGLFSLHSHRDRRNPSYDQLYRQILEQHHKVSPGGFLLTKDALWLSESPVGDLASCLLLLVIHNERSGDVSSSDPTSPTPQPPSALIRWNPFRSELASLADSRWEQDVAQNEPLFGSSVDGLEDLPDLPPMANGSIGGGDGDAPLTEALIPASSTTDSRNSDVLTFNFEHLFESFGRTAHSEVGAVLLYTLIQSSQAFSSSIAVRSDLDTIVLPLLRTLYFSSATQRYEAQDYTSRGGGGTRNLADASSAIRRNSNDSASSQLASGNQTGAISIRSCPFRSQSQLYVIIILLLLLSQDPSFGRDAFRRVHVPNVLWYKEGHVKDINLGSVVLLCLLRSLAFNLNRLHDAFLVSNCCAILMNLSPNMTDLHQHAAMVLVSTTISFMKKYLELRAKHPEDDDMNGDDGGDEAMLLSTPTSMRGEVTRTLLVVLKQCLSHKNVDRNVNLVYALMYYQADWKKQTKQKGSPFKKSKVERVDHVIEAASAVIEQQGGAARTAAKALKALSDNMDRIQQAVAEPSSKRLSSSKRDAADAFMFTYEEESDPESFFVPYIWEVIVCVATASLMDWNKAGIRVFPLLEDPTMADERQAHPSPHDGDGRQREPILSDRAYSKDVSDVV